MKKKNHPESEGKLSFCSDLPDQQTQIINQNESQLCTIELGQKNHQASRFDLNYVKLKKDL